MAEAKRDQNYVTTILATSSVDGVTPVNVWADPVTHRLLVDNASSSSITIGTTIATSGTVGSVLFVGTGPVIQQDNANFFYSTANGLRIGPTSAAITTENKLSIIGNANDYHGGFFQNQSAGTIASTDIVLTNDLGTADLATYADLTLNSSGNTNPAMTLFGGSDLSLFTSGQINNINIATGTTGKVIKFAVGGLLIANEVGRFTATGLTVGLTGTTLGKIIFSGSTSTSITLQGQAIGSSSVLTLPTGTDTLVGLALSQALTNKTYNGNTVTAGTGTLTLSTFTLTVAGTASVSGTNTGDQTNISGNAATVTTNANLTGPVTSVGNATTIAAGVVTEAMQVLADNTTQNVSTTKHGYAPKAPNDATKYLDGTGAYSTPTTTLKTVIAFYSQGSALSAATNNYSNTFTSINSGTGEDEVAFPLAVAGTIKNLYVRNRTAATNDVTVTLYKNGSASTLTTTVTATNTGNFTDLTHTVSVAAGDRISMRISSGAGTQAYITGLTVEFDPT